MKLLSSRPVLLAAALCVFSASLAVAQGYQGLVAPPAQNQSQTDEPPGYKGVIPGAVPAETPRAEAPARPKRTEIPKASAPASKAAVVPVVLPQMSLPERMNTSDQNMTPEHPDTFSMEDLKKGPMVFTRPPRYLPLPEELKLSQSEINALKPPTAGIDIDQYLASPENLKMRAFTAALDKNGNGMPDAIEQKIASLSPGVKIPAGYAPTLVDGLRPEEHTAKIIIEGSLKRLSDKALTPQQRKTLAGEEYKRLGMIVDGLLMRSSTPRALKQLMGYSDAYIDGQKAELTAAIGMYNAALKQLEDDR